MACRLTMFFVVAVAGMSCCGAASAAGSAGTGGIAVTWDYLKDVYAGGGQLVYSHSAVDIGGGSLSGSVPSFLGHSWPLTSGRCWTGVSGEHWDNSTCGFAIEKTKRAAKCRRSKKVHVRVWVGKGKHRHRVWRWRRRTVKMQRTVPVTVQLEVAHDPGGLYYFYPEKQWAYGPGGPTDVYPPDIKPIDAHYPRAGTKTIECAAPKGISRVEEGASDNAYP